MLMVFLKEKGGYDAVAYEEDRCKKGKEEG